MTVAFVVAVAIFLGLLLFLANELRRPVHVTKWEGRGQLWGKRLRIALAGILLLLVGVVGWAFFIEPNRLIVRHETIQMQQWPASLSNLKIAVLSDIHVGGSFIDDDKVRTIVQRTNELQPDLIVIAGDYISGGARRRPAREPETFAPLLKEFRAPLGVYSVLGNHDWWYDGPRVRRALEENGIKVLENETARLDVRGTTLWLVGLADLWTRTPRIQESTGAIPDGEAIIALTHNPDIFPRLPQRVALMIAGHTHGAQVRLPLVGPVVQASRVSEAYTRGHVFENGHHLFVTTGIGTSIMPVRFGVPPEIVLLTLTSPTGVSSASSAAAKSRNFRTTRAGALVASTRAVAVQSVTCPLQKTPMNDTFALTEFELWQPVHTRLEQDIRGLGDLLHDCVHSGASVSFILPFTREEAAAFWRTKVWPAVEDGTCRVIVARRDEQIVGTVQVDLATPPNQPHRGEIKKLLVHPSVRRAGIARGLMRAIEEQARAAQRTLLTLDTASAGAEHLYASLGYVRVGVIPRFSLRPDASALEGTTVMYKELSPAS